MKPVKSINVTFSLPINLNNKLHTMVERRRLSRFVAEAIQEALQKKTITLREEYIASDNDPETREILSDWERIDGEGWE